MAGLSGTGTLPKIIASAATLRSSTARLTSFVRKRRRCGVWPLAAAILVLVLPGARVTSAPVDVSPQPVLQWFESSYRTIEDRAADIFLAGYGFVWLPPPFRADQGDFSVGYDVYDRFDLGRPERPTLQPREARRRQRSTVLRSDSQRFRRVVVSSSRSGRRPGAPEAP